MLPKVGEVFAVPLRRGWGACQVLSRDAKHVEVVTLDHHSAAMPALADVALRPLRVDHHYWSEHIDRTHVTGAPPSTYVALGVAALAVAAEPPGTSWGSWARYALQPSLQTRWNALPAPARAAFHASRNSNRRVRVKLPSGEADITVGTSDLTLDLSAPAGAYDFGHLDALPCLLHLDVIGEAPGLVAWLASRPMIEELRWRGTLPGTIDLRATGLTECRLESDAAHDVSVPDDLDALSLTVSPTARWRVHALADGAHLSPTLRTPTGEGIDHVEGLAAAEALSLTDVVDLDLRRVTRRYRPRSLTVYGAPGALRHAEALADVTVLTALSVWGCLDVDAAHMPALSQWPALERAEVVEARADEAAALKARWGRDRRVSVRSAVSDEKARYLTGHGFLGWRDVMKRGQAAGAFATAAKRIDAAGGDVAVVRKAMQGYARAVQRMIAQAGALTADEARDVAAVWGGLLARVSPPIDDAEGDRWRDAWRSGW